MADNPYTVYWPSQHRHPCPDCKCPPYPCPGWNARTEKWCRLAKEHPGQCKYEEENDGR